MNDDDIISIFDDKNENSSSSNEVIVIENEDDSSNFAATKTDESCNSEPSYVPKIKQPSSRKKYPLRPSRSKKGLKPPDLIIINDDDTQLPELLNDNTSGSPAENTLPSTPVIMNSTIRSSPEESPNHVFSNDQIISSYASTPHFSDDYNKLDAQIIDKDFCLLATKTLNKKNDERNSSVSSVSFSSQSSLQRFIPNPKSDLPKYNSVKNFNPKICFSMKILNNDRNEETNQKKSRSDIEIRPLVRGKVLPVECFNVTAISQTLNYSSTSSSSFTILKEKKTISVPSNDSSCAKRKRYDDYKLNIEPIVVVKNMTLEDIEYQQRLLKLKFSKMQKILFFNFHYYNFELI